MPRVHRHTNDRESNRRRWLGLGFGCSPKLCVVEADADQRKDGGDDSKHGIQ